MLKASHQMMWAAIEAAEDEETPFGTALTMGEELFATAACPVGEIHNIEKHAENKVIEKLSEQLRKNDLSGFSLYSTCQPFQAVIQKVSEAGIGILFYGCSHSQALRFLPGELYKPEKLGNREAGIEIIGEILEMECYQLLKRFGTRS
jgi:tRNA(adenine34) deaminase